MSKWEPLSNSQRRTLFIVPNTVFIFSSFQVTVKISKPLTFPTKQLLSLTAHFERHCLVSLQWPWRFNCRLEPSNVAHFFFKLKVYVHVQNIVYYHITPDVFLNQNRCPNLKYSVLYKLQKWCIHVASVMMYYLSYHNSICVEKEIQPIKAYGCAIWGT